MNRVYVWCFDDSSRRQKQSEKKSLSPRNARFKDSEAIGRLLESSSTAGECRQQTVTKSFTICSFLILLEKSLSNDGDCACLLFPSSSSLSLPPLYSFSSVVIVVVHASLASFDTFFIIVVIALEITMTAGKDGTSVAILSLCARCERPIHSINDFLPRPRE